MLFRYWKLGLLVLACIVLVGVVMSMAGSDVYLTPRQHLLQSGVVFDDSPVLSLLTHEPAEAVELARRRSTVSVGSEACGTAYPVYYSEPAPTMQPPEPAWLVHFAGTNVPVKVGGGLDRRSNTCEREVVYLSNIVIILGADGSFIKAIGIPDESWNRADAADPFELDRQ